MADERWRLKNAECVETKAEIKLSEIHVNGRLCREYNKMELNNIDVKEN